MVNIEDGSGAEIGEFDTAADALAEFLDRMIYWRSRRDLAETIIDELPWNGYHIVKMTEEEKQEFLEDYETWYKEEFSEEDWENGIDTD